MFQPKGHYLRRRRSSTGGSSSSSNESHSLNLSTKSLPSSFSSRSAWRPSRPSFRGRFVSKPPQQRVEKILSDLSNNLHRNGVLALWVVVSTSTMLLVVFKVLDIGLGPISVLDSRHHHRSTPSNVYFVTREPSTTETVLLMTVIINLLCGVVIFVYSIFTLSPLHSKTAQSPNIFTTPESFNLQQSFTQIAVHTTTIGRYVLSRSLNTLTTVSPSYIGSSVFGFITKLNKKCQPTKTGLMEVGCQHSPKFEEIKYAANLEQLERGAEITEKLQPARTGLSEVGCQHEPELEEIKYPPHLRQLDLTERIQLENLFCWGGYSNVFKGVWETSVGHVEVAVKSLRMPGITDLDVMEDRLLKRFFREALVWSVLRHPNVVPLLGLTMPLKSPVSFVLPFYPNGNVVEYVRSHPEADRLKLVSDIACGLIYLHALPVAHGDIKGENVLVDGKGRACINDFGMSKFVDDARRVCGFTTPNAHLGGTLRFLCPEVLFDEPKTAMTDMWAFGCLIAQIWTDTIPYSHIRQNGAVVNVILLGEPPFSIGECTINYPLEESLRTIITRCWSMEPNYRPTADDLHAVVQTEMRRLRKPRHRHRRLAKLHDESSSIHQKSTIEEPELLDANFIPKLIMMLEDSDMSDNTYWSNDGMKFIVRRIPDFAQQDLPIYYGHFSLERFLEELDMHGFQITKKRCSINTGVYGETLECSHPLFARDHKSLLC